MTRIAVVAQRYGAEINGGAELHARYIAEHLARHASVEVLTTCARDYVTWRNDVAPGTETVNGLTVRRFPVSRERDPIEFGRRSLHVFDNRHSLRDELAWLEAEGPTSPALVRYLRDHAGDYDFFVFFSARYYHAYHGVRAVGRKAILVPTMERDEALGLGLFPPIFRGAGAVMYNSFEERALIQAVSGNHDVPSVVVGVGSEVPSHVEPARFRARFGIDARFAIYVGRIDENKGCAELFSFFTRYDRVAADDLHLVLIGTPVMPIPVHPRIHHLGFVSDEEKFDALSAATVLVMPSYLESLSMVLLEAWALGVPVLANGRCDVLKGQCLRSNGGLYYESFGEFVETLAAISGNDALAAALGAQGREYYRRHYTWPTVERKYLDMIEKLSGDTGQGPSMEPLPGLFARWSKTLPPARSIVDGLPVGAVRAPKDAVRDAPVPVRQTRRPPARAPERESTRAASAPRADASDRRGSGRQRRPGQARGSRGGDRRARPPRRPNGR